MQVIRTVLLPVLAVVIIGAVVYMYNSSWAVTVKNRFPRPKSGLNTEFPPSVRYHGSQSSDVAPEAERTTLKAKTQNETLPSRPNKEKVILLTWTSSYKKGPWIVKTHIEDSYGYQCLFTSDKSLFSESDLVVLHGKAPNIQGLVKQALTLNRPPHQRWVYLIRESPANTPNPRFLNGHINWTVNFMTDADLAARSVVVPGTFQGGFDPGKNYLEKKTGMAVLLVSNCAPARMNWVRTMQRYIDVKVYGNCGTLKCSRTNKEECIAELRKYKFYIAFENTFCKDYITEKFYVNSLQNGLVPIVLSGVNTSDDTYVPPGSFINALDFPTVKDLTDHMTKVGSSPELYNEYFRWRSNYTLIFRSNSTTLLRRLCEKVHLDPVSEKSYSDLGGWYSSERNCKTYPVPVPL